MHTAREARKFSKRYRIKKEITFDQAKETACEMGFEVMFFNPADTKQTTMLQNATGNTFLPSNNSFLYSLNGKKVIFLSQFTSKNDQTYLLLHELAHIFLNHGYRTDLTEVEKEKQANDLATYLIKKKRYSGNTAQMIFGWFFLLSCIACLAVAKFTTPKQLPSVSPSPRATVIIQNGEVLVTKSGNKYHRPDCRYISNKKHYPLPLSEAEEAGYTPCSYCYSENQ